MIRGFCPQRPSVPPGPFRAGNPHEVAYVARSNSPRVVSIGFHAGARVPAHVVGPGTVLMAALPDEALQAWVAAHPFAGFSAGTVTAPEVSLAQVRAARGQRGLGPQRAATAGKPESRAPSAAGASIGA